MIDVEGVLGVALLLLWVYCIFDVIASEAAVVRNLPKMVWLIIVLVLPDVGALAWLILGRPEKAGWRPGDTTVRDQRRPPRHEDIGLIENSIAERDRLIALWEQEEAERKRARREAAQRPAPSSGPEDDAPQR